VPSFLAKGLVLIVMNCKRCVSFSLRDCNFLQMFSCEKNTAFFTDYFMFGKVLLSAYSSLSLPLCLPKMGSFL
jgi:hypothetical protein